MGQALFIYGSTDPSAPLPATRVPIKVSAAGEVQVGLVAGAASLGATKDDGPNWTSAWGVSNAPVTSADMSGADADLSAAPTAGQKLVVADILISAAAAMTVSIKEETSGTVMFSVVFGAGGGFAQFTPRSKRKLPTADKKIVGRTTAAGNVSILAAYYSES